jgi:hypothetical protein
MRTTMEAAMAMKHRAPRYDNGADSATRPDIVSAQGDWDEWSPASLAQPPSRWNDATVPDLPLRISMAAPPDEPAPANTAIPRSGTRHRAVSKPPVVPTLAELAAEYRSRSSAPPAREEVRPSVAPQARPRASTWAPLAVAVTGIAAAVGAALGTGLTQRFESGRSVSPPRAAASLVVAPSPRPPATVHEARDPSRPGARTIPEVSYEDLPLLAKDSPDAGAPRRRLKARAR